MTYSHKQAGWIRRFIRWFAGSPFEHLPRYFGDTVPPDLRVFEAKTAEQAHHVHVEPVDTGAPPHHQLSVARSHPELERQ